VRNANAYESEIETLRDRLRRVNECIQVTGSQGWASFLEQINEKREAASKKLLLERQDDYERGLLQGQYRELDALSRLEDDCAKERNGIERRMEELEKLRSKASMLQKSKQPKPKGVIR